MYSERIDATVAVIGPPEEAVKELFPSYHHRCAGRANGVLLPVLTIQRLRDLNAQGGE